MILKRLIAAAIGGGLEFAFYKFVGCSTGARPLTSNPIISTICGAVMDALIATSFR